MSRGIDSAVTTDVSTERHIRLVSFVALELDSGTVYLHDSIGTFSFGGNDYLGVGDFGGISTIEENQQMSAYEITLVLSGLDADLLDEALNQNYQGRPVTIYLGAIDLDTGALLATPNEIWSGVTDIARIALGAGNENAIEITCESDFAKLEKINGRTFSDADLQAEYAGDTFLQYLAAMEDAKVVWRGENANKFGKPGRDGNDPRIAPKFMGF